MGYKYDPQNGYRNADQLNADIDEFNPEVVRTVNQAKECEKEKDNDKATRNFINRTALNIQENIKQPIKKEIEVTEKSEIPSYYIAAGIKAEMEKQELNDDDLGR